MIKCGVNVFCPSQAHELDGLLHSGFGTAYGKPEDVLKELAQAMTATGSSDEFRRSLVALQSAHGHRPGWAKY